MNSLCRLFGGLLLLCLAGLALFLAGCGSSGSTSTKQPPPAVVSLVVSDNGNNRVLIYNAPFSTDQSANVVLGQADFTTGGTALSATGMNDPWTTAKDSAGNIYVADASNGRVLQFKPPFSNGMSASLVIGQPDFVTAIANNTQNGLTLPLGLAFDGGGNLWVADRANCRILQYKPPFATDMNASLVLGQPDFTSNGCATSSTGLESPTYLAFDSSGNLWVSDTNNSRVLEFTTPFSNGMAASLVIGQTDLVSSVRATTASGLWFPFGVAFDSAGNLWVGDTSNNRVLQFKPPFSIGMSASLVLGQDSFTNNACATTQNGFCTAGNPMGLAFDSSGNLWVADGFNSRTLEFTPPFSTNQNASLVLGQANFTSNAKATTATGQWYPWAVSAF